ncbi:MAG: two-component system nitrogen regulation response regulator NtrX [Sphingobacteriales bacterium]
MPKSFLLDICKDYGIPAKTFSKDAVQALQDRSWSGNIRELRNVIERLVTLSDQEITSDDIKSFAYGGSSQQVEDNIYEMFNTLQDFREYTDKQFLTAKLEKNKFDLGKTSKEIKIPPRNIEEMMFQFDIVKPKSIGRR